MHIQSSRTEDGEPYVLVGEPWQADDGTVYGPEVQLWPLGAGTGTLLTFLVPEARAQIAALQRGVDEAEALFPAPPGQT